MTELADTTHFLANMDLGLTQPASPKKAPRVARAGSVKAGVHRGAKAARPTQLDNDAALNTEAALAVAEMLVGDAVSVALAEDGRSLRALSREAKLDPAFVSRLSEGKNCTVSSLARLALALGKTLRISIE